jgi:hypothetical protein
MSQKKRDLIKYFGDNNPGGISAISILADIPDMRDDMFDFMYKYGLIGSRLWDLYKNVCGKDNKKIVHVIEKLKNTRYPFSVVEYSSAEKKDIYVLKYLDRFVK